MKIKFKKYLVFSASCNIFCLDSPKDDCRPANYMKSIDEGGAASAQIKLLNQN